MAVRLPESTRGASGRGTPSSAAWPAAVGAVAARPDREARGSLERREAAPDLRCAPCRGRWATPSAGISHAAVFSTAVDDDDDEEAPMSGTDAAWPLGFPTLLRLLGSAPGAAAAAASAADDDDNDNGDCGNAAVPKTLGSVVRSSGIGSGSSPADAATSSRYSAVGTIHPRMSCADRGSCRNRQLAVSRSRRQHVPSARTAPSLSGLMSQCVTPIWCSLATHRSTRSTVPRTAGAPCRWMLPVRNASSRVASTAG